MMLTLCVAVLQMVGMAEAELHRWDAHGIMAAFEPLGWPAGYRGKWVTMSPDERKAVCGSTGVKTAAKLIAGAALWSMHLAAMLNESSKVKRYLDGYRVLFNTVTKALTANTHNAAEELAEQLHIDYQYTKYEDYTMSASEPMQEEDVRQAPTPGRGNRPSLETDASHMQEAVGECVVMAGRTHEQCAPLVWSGGVSVNHVGMHTHHMVATVSLRLPYILAVHGCTCESVMLVCRGSRPGTQHAPPINARSRAAWQGGCQANPASHKSHHQRQGTSSLRGCHGGTQASTSACQGCTPTSLRRRQGGRSQQGRRPATRTRCGGR
jgi:hypothetical protein